MNPDQPELSIHVVRTHSDHGEILFHTLTKESLPVDAAPARLEAELFLKGQEAQAIERGLFRPRRRLALTTVVTWACNLRCSHCNVIDRLEKETLRALDPHRLRDFILRYLAFRPTVEEVSIALLGGEPLLAPSQCEAILDATSDLGVEMNYHMTTNLAVPLGEAELGVLRRIDRIAVSLDGPKEAHNEQRVPVWESMDPYERTLANLKLLVDGGLADRVHVQAAVPDEHANRESMAAFYRALMAVGIHANKAMYGTIHPTPKRPRPTETYLASRADPVVRHRPCCKFRGGSNLIVGDNDQIYSDFNDWEHMGALDEPIDVLLERHEALTRERMPALRDPRCMACPALGVCWGGCVDGSPVYGDRPSDLCDQQRLVDEMESRAAAGTLATAPD